MIVTEIEEMTKTRSKVFVDGEFAFVLYKGELRQFHIKVGEELTQKAQEEIFCDILPKRARVRAMNLLLKRDYTTMKLREKLAEGGYPEAVIEEALEYVEAFHYTDDMRYALNYIMCHQENKSRKQLEMDLKQRGISPEVLEKAWAQWEEDGGRQDEAKMIHALLQKRHYEPEKATRQQQQREYAFLMRKGFSAEKVRNAVFGRFEEW